MTYPPSPSCKNLTLSGCTAHQGIFFLESLNFQIHKAAGTTQDISVAQGLAQGSARGFSLQESLWQFKKLARQLEQNLRRPSLSDVPPALECTRE